MPNELEKVDPLKKRKLNLAELIEQLSENLIAHGKLIASFEEQSRRFYNVLESVGTESGRIYNEFTSDRNRRERQLEQKIERLEADIRAQQQSVDFFRLQNAYLKGRLGALEQVAKIEPIPAPVVEDPVNPPHFGPPSTRNFDPGRIY